MKTRLEQVLERCLNGREIAVWGTPTRMLLRVLKPYKYHIAGTVERQIHYVVAVNNDDGEDFMMDEQSEPFKHVEDFLIYDDFGEELPFEWNCYGAVIGRQTYFGEGFAEGCDNGYIESIGHFTSINGSASMGVNHQLNMVFTSDELAEFYFSAEDDALYERKVRSDPGHPFARNKPRITIGSDVYIGANAFINASKVKSIGDGAIIGSGAIVLDDVPPYAVVVGVPAKIIRYRFTPEMIDALLRVKWWDWPNDKIKANADALMSPKIFMERFKSS
jgi:aminocyclitol acetyltransferase